MPLYTFDVRLYAAISVEADSEEAARTMIRAECDGAECNAGAWPDGSPILFDAHMDDDEIPLVEVDGEAV